MLIYEVLSGIQCLIKLWQWIGSLSCWHWRIRSKQPNFVDVHDGYGPAWLHMFSCKIHRVHRLIRVLHISTLYRCLGEQNEIKPHEAWEKIRCSNFKFWYQYTKRPARNPVHKYNARIGFKTWPNQNYANWLINFYHGFKYWSILIYISNIVLGFEILNTILTNISQCRGDIADIEDIDTKTIAWLTPRF